jgi:elongation factor P
LATTADIKNGVVLLHRGKRMKVVEFLHVKPGKGGAFVRTKLKDIQSGKVIEETFNAGSRIELVRVEARGMQFLYQDGEAYVFMDLKTYDQLPIPQEVVGEKHHFLKPGLDVELLFDGEVPLDIRLPAHVELEVTHTEPGYRGNTATGATKPAELETGFTVQVPIFIEKGDRLKIDTRTGAYIERAKRE